MTPEEKATRYITYTLFVSIIPEENQREIVNWKTGEIETRNIKWFIRVKTLVPIILMTDPYLYWLNIFEGCELGQEFYLAHNFARYDYYSNENSNENWREECMMGNRPYAFRWRLPPVKIPDDFMPFYSPGFCNLF